MTVNLNFKKAVKITHGAREHLLKIRKDSVISELVKNRTQLEFMPLKSQKTKLEKVCEEMQNEIIGFETENSKIETEINSIKENDFSSLENKYESILKKINEFEA